jgi:hypothetical protein
MTRSKIIGLLVIGFALVAFYIGNDFMSGHHIRSELKYGNISEVEGSRLALSKYEYYYITLICDELDASLASELEVEAAGRRFKVAGLTLKEFEALGIPTKNDDYENWGARRLLEASNGHLSMFFGKDGKLYSVSIRFSSSNDATKTNTVALHRNKVTVNGETDTEHIKTLLGEPKDRSLSLRIP